MNKNAPKIILAGVLLVAALGLILWNMGVIGGGGSTATLNEDNAVGETDPEALKKQNETASPDQPGSLQGLKKDAF